MLGFAEVRSFASNYCNKCHGDKVQKNGINLAPFTDEKSMLRQRKLWREVVAQVKSGEMPPEDQKQPSKESRDRFILWVTRKLDAADKADREQPDPGRVVVRRLTRSEYNHSVRDLLGTDFDIAGAVGMADDPVGEAFDNLAEALNFSEALMEKYFAAADLAIEKLYSTALKKGQKQKPTEPLPLFDVIVFAKPGAELSARDAARQVIKRLARRAYRRSTEERDIDRLLKLHDAGIAKGHSYEEALKPVLKAVLVSPNFLLRIERNRAKNGNAAYRISDDELAVRLSYFLWSTMPDAELFELADKGELSKPDVFEKQVRRLLADPKARALTESFADQWLLLRKLPEARPSTEFFPTLTPRLRQAMADEVSTFFDKLRVEDRGLLDLLDSDYTYVNAELARHYGITGVMDGPFQRVALTDPSRGGLLGMAAMHTLTSHTSRTSPTLRGKYILSVILGTPPPPPPPDAGVIDESKKGKDAATFREQLKMHASQSACANCHARIDPLGFGLENFDAIGRFRKSGGAVDASGKLPTGEAFNGPKELKQVLLKRKGQFVRNLSARMLSYALGREIEQADEPVLNNIVADLESHDYRFSRLILGIVQSYPFQHRRNLRAEETRE